MKASSVCAEFIIGFESMHDGDLSMIGLQPKMDPISIWTEGYGRAMRDSKGNFLKGAKDKAAAMKGITIHNKKEAYAALLVDLESRERIVMQNIKVPLNQNQFDALVSYVYNTGGSNTLYNLINNKAPEREIKLWMTTHYITADGVVMNGLIKRRRAECALFLTPINTK
jgi:lysozyme